MKVIPWFQQSPVATLSTDFEGLFKDFFGGNRSRLPEAFRGASMPAVNLADTEKEFVASVELPGLDEKDIEIQVLGSQLVISGERKWEEEKTDKEYYRIESQYGAFRRAIELPEGLNLDSDAIKANYEKGMLEVRIPKVEPRPAAKIKVKARGK
jgi:HSP20 family protein